MIMTIHNILIYLLIAAVGLILFRTFFDTMIGKEGFTQSEKFVLKKDADSYDDFYAQIYDSIHLPDPKKELESILEIVEPDKHSVILDVGSGTGCTLNTLVESGAKCMGVDKSDAMIAVAKDKYGAALPLQKGDVTDPILFDRNKFSHILCLDATIYEIQNKHAFFTNCRYWLQNGGFLVLHLVDKHRFNTVVKAGRPMLIENPQKYASERITKTEIDFHDFTYLSKYNINVKGPCTFVETFTDGTTQHMRQNERTLFMESDDEILRVASQCGFSQHAQINMEPVNDDQYQNIYVLI
jgi:SAM-dependent methyltransferase